MYENNLEALWQKVKNEMEGRIARPTFQTFIEPTAIVGYNNDTYIVYTDNEFSKSSLELHIHDLETILSHFTSKPSTIKLVTDKNPNLELLKKPNEQNEAQTAYDKRTIREKFHLNPDYTFDNFVVGNSNQFAHVASLSIAESMSRDLNCPKKYNPMFIYGGSGLGKTHLMHAVANHILHYQPEARIIYVTIEEFMNDFISSIGSMGSNRNKMDLFKEKYRSTDILLIDDIQFLKGKTETQEEFFHTFNALYQNNKQIILTSDRHPKEIETLEDRLRTRFENGVIADVQPPNLETRIAILRKKVQTEGHDVSDEVIMFMAENIESSIRELEGSLLTLTAFANLNSISVTVDLAKDVLQSRINNTKTQVITIETIQNLVCQTYGVRYDDLIGKKRPQNIAFPRQIAMYLCRELTENSLPKIGEHFGGRDHSTILHGIEKVKETLKKDPAFKANLNHLINELKGEA